MVVTSAELLDAVEAAINGSLAVNQQNISIAGRSLSKIPVLELFQIRDQLRREVRAVYNRERGISDVTNRRLIV